MLAGLSHSAKIDKLTSYRFDSCRVFHLKSEQAQPSVSQNLCLFTFFYLGQFIKIPYIIYPAFIEVWFVADHENGALVGLEGPF